MTELACCSGEPCAEHSNPPSNCLDCGHCHPCHIQSDFPAGAQVLGEHPVPISIGIREAQVFHLASPQS